MVGTQMAVPGPEALRINKDYKLKDTSGDEGILLNYGIGKTARFLKIVINFLLPTILIFS